MAAITPEDIKALPTRYAIGKRPLSIALGWGELTYTRLLAGNTPSPEHAAELQRLFDDPAQFARTLDANRNKITEAAYTRSLQAVDDLLANEGGAARATRIFAVADKLCALAKGDLTPNALQQLVFLAQGTCLARAGALPFDDLPLATEAGAFYERLDGLYTYDEIQSVASRAANDSIEEQATGCTTPLSASEIKALEAAYKTYGHSSGQELSRLVCESAPWRKARKRAKAEASQGRFERMTEKNMRKYFSKL